MYCHLMPAIAVNNSNKYLVNNSENICVFMT